MVAKMTFEPMVEPVFHHDSYGYRPHKSALDAVDAARKRCWQMDWVIDLDIRDFFGSIDHELMLKAVKRHTNLKWIHLYMERWLKAPLQLADGTLRERTAGTPQGGVISPVISNVFMHYAFDAWMGRTFPTVPFERYADDALIHCATQAQAEHVLETLRGRLQECGLELHPVKTKIVYCKDANRKEDFELQKFDFLGFTFRPRLAKNQKKGVFFVCFLPAMSDKAAKAVRQTIRAWKLAGKWNRHSLEDLAKFVNPFAVGWMNYYGRFYRSECHRALRHLNEALVKWVMWKFLRFRRREIAAAHYLGCIAARDEKLFAHWRFGLKPATGR